MTPLELIRAAARESREREEKATPGPWRQQTNDPSTIIDNDGSDLAWAYRTPTRPVDKHGNPLRDDGSIEWKYGNAAFIAAARTELGEWREATERACEALDKVLDRAAKGDISEGDITDLCGSALTVLAEKLRMGRG